MASGIANATGVSFASGQAFFDFLITNFFWPTLADARNNSCVLWSLLTKKAPTTVAGDFIVWPLRVGRNRGRNAIREGGQLPDPGNQGAKQCIANPRTYMARVKIDGATMRRSKNPGGSWIEPVMFELDGQIADLMIDRNRMAHNDGSGRLCEVSSLSTTTITAKINTGIEGAATCTTPATLHLEVGDRVGFYNNAGAADAYKALTTGSQVGLYVVAISGNTFQVSTTVGGAAIDVGGGGLFTGGTNLAAGDWVVRYSTEAASKNVSSSGAAKAEMTGIGGIISDGGVQNGLGASSARQQGATDFTTAAVTTFQGNVASSTNPWNQAVILDSPSSPRPLTFRLMQQALSDFEEKNNGDTKFMLFPYGTYNSFVALADADKRYVNTTTISTGHDVITFNGIPAIKDRYCYGNRIIGLDPDQLAYLEIEALRPTDYEDVPRWTKVQDFDEYFTGFVESGEMVSEGPRQRAGWALVDLSA